MFPDILRVTELWTTSFRMVLLCWNFFSVCWPRFLMTCSALLLQYCQIISGHSVSYITMLSTSKLTPCLLFTWHILVLFLSCVTYWSYIHNLNVELLYTENCIWLKWENIKCLHKPLISKWLLCVIIFYY